MVMRNCAQNVMKIIQKSVLLIYLFVHLFLGVEFWVKCDRTLVI